MSASAQLDDEHALLCSVVCRLPFCGTVVLAALLFLTASAHWAQADLPPRPAAGSATIGKFEEESLARTSATVDSTTAYAAATPAKTSNFSPGLDTTRVVIALFAVVVLILILRYMGQRFLGLPIAKSNSAVRVISRTTISPRQQVLLLQVGKRVLVIGENHTALSPLGEITDADEIASLVGQISEQRAGGAATGAFGSVFSRARREFVEPDSSGESPPERAMPADPSMEETQTELSGLLDKVRAVSRQLADR